MLPYFMGIDGEEEYGPAAVYDANWAINKNASDKDKKASLDFIKWIVSSDTGKKTLAKEMGFAVPFTTFGDDEQPDNPLVAAAKVWSDDKGKKTVYSANIPGQQWMDNISNALVEYTQGTGRMGRRDRCLRQELEDRMDRLQGFHWHASAVRQVGVNHHFGSHT